LLTVPQLAAVVGDVTCTVFVAPVATSPKLHVSVPLAIEQPDTAGLIDQLVPAVVGSTSVSVTPVAVPAPVFVTVIVKPIASPALTGEPSAVFVMSIDAQFTVVVADACTCAWLLACADAVFGYAAHEAPVVGELTCTVLDGAAAARSPKLHDSTFAVMEQPATAGSTDQLIPVPVGSGSESVTDFAVPCPVLLTTIVNPIALPALTDAASAVFEIASAGHFTSTDASA
jgi:hypothetical protein